MNNRYLYRAIGTPEECRAAMEKQKTKKPIIERCEKPEGWCKQ